MPAGKVRRRRERKTDTHRDSKGERSGGRQMDGQTDKKGVRAKGRGSNRE